MQISSSLDTQNMFRSRVHSKSDGELPPHGEAQRRGDARRMEIEFKPEELLGKVKHLPQSLSVISDQQDNSKPGKFIIKGGDSASPETVFESRPFDSFAQAVVHTPFVTDENSWVAVYHVDAQAPGENPYGLELQKEIPRFKLKDWQEEGLKGLC